jgi:hypothetical protein
VSQYPVGRLHMVSLVQAVIIAPPLLEEPPVPEELAPLEVAPDDPPEPLPPPEAPDEDVVASSPPPDAPDEPPSPPEFPLLVVVLPPHPIPMAIAIKTPAQALEAHMRLPSVRRPTPNGGRAPSLP